MRNYTEIQYPALTDFDGIQDSGRKYMGRVTKLAGVKAVDRKRKILTIINVMGTNAIPDGLQ